MRVTKRDAVEILIWLIHQIETLKARTVLTVGQQLEVAEDLQDMQRDVNFCLDMLSGHPHHGHYMAMTKEI
jgi:hypothetical protein